MATNLPTNRIQRPSGSAGLLAAMIVTASVVSGCNSFSTTSNLDNGRTLTVLDNRLPNSLDTAFEACSERIDIDGGASDVIIADTCDTEMLTSTQDFVAAAALASYRTVELDEPIPTTLVRSTETYGGFPWPVQNCEVELDYTFEFSGLRLDDLDARWRHVGGDPRLVVDFDFPRRKIGEVSISTAVHCPHGISRSIVKALTKTLRRELNGRHNVLAHGMDLDLTFDIDHDGEQLLVTLDTDFDVNSISIDLDWTKVETIRLLGIPIPVVDRDDILEPAKDIMLEEGGAIFSEALAGLADNVEDGLNGLVPTGHRICDLRGTNSSMEMETAPGSDRLACMRIRLNRRLTSSLGPRFP
ncbi:MAG: hypothetical protein VX589_17915 [Myxococcota bacterium]|nr:hypothetical protein [Myxococcota bacterium]